MKRACAGSVSLADYGGRGALVEATTRTRAASSTRTDNDPGLRSGECEHCRCRLTRERRDLIAVALSSRLREYGIDGAHAPRSVIS